MSSQKIGQAKSDHISSILTELQKDLSKPKLSVQQRQQLLEQLKVYGRSIQDADPLFTQDGLQILGRCAFIGDATAASQEALRCIANALLLVPRIRQPFVDLGYGVQASEKFRSHSIDTEFLVARILFLLTYDTQLNYPDLVDSKGLARSINLALARHSARYSLDPRCPSQEHTQPMDLMALSETLKLLFNVTHFHPQLASRFSPSIASTFHILVRRGVTKEPLAEPANFLVNALLNLDLENPAPKASETNQGDEGDETADKLHTEDNPVFPSSDATRNTTHLISMLSASLTAYPESNLDSTVAPLLTLIRRIYEIAPVTVKSNVESLLLPSANERDKPLGHSATLASRLLNLTTSALTPTLRGSISAMFFELSHKDPATFVANVGYGFASGFLMSNNITIPESVMRAHAPSEALAGIPVNPITGQRLDSEDKEQEEEPMTQEEKEREAERLFVLFERLKATGVVDVQNPVEEAYRSGRIQELNDDED